MIRPNLLVFAVLLAFSAPARGQPEGSPQAEAMLQQAEALYEQLEYEAALEVLVQVQGVQGTADLQRARAFLYMGVCFTALGRSEDAVQAFTSLLKLKADFRLPDGVSPSIQAMFKEALTRLKMPDAPPATAPAGPGDGAAETETETEGEGEGEEGGTEPQQPPPGAGSEGIPVEIEAQGPARAKAGQPVAVKVAIKDPADLVRRVVLRWRRVEGGKYSQVKLPWKPGQSEEVRGTIPAVTVDEAQGHIHWFVEATGSDGMTLAHDGSLNDPLVLVLEGAGGGKSNVKWWLVGIGAGLLVAGGVVAAVLLTRPDDSGPLPDYAVGTVVIR